MERNHQEDGQGRAETSAIFRTAKNGIDIAFQNLSYKVKIVAERSKHLNIPCTRKYKDKIILRQISGIFKAGQVSAIMGASGAGKTTLLNVLACRVKHQSNGRLYANGIQYGYNQFGDFANYVMQHDVLMQTLTVRQTLQFATDLKVNASKAQRKQMVERLADELKLQKCLDTLVGGVIVKGVSGGQKKRTSIAFQLITDPQVIFLDEPTSGLDSLTSWIIVGYMKKLAHKNNKTIIMTIHQPNSEIYALIDNLLLLVDGKIIYQGAAVNVKEYFATNFNLLCPEFSNPPDFFMSKIHHQDIQNRNRYPLYMSTYDQNQKGQIQNQIQSRQRSQIQFRKIRVQKRAIYKALSYRNWINTVRNPMLLKSKFLQGIFISVFAGGVFFGKGHGDLTNSDDWYALTGALFFISINAFTTSLSPVTITFPMERPVFLKEQDSKMYTVSEYSLSKLILDIPQLIIIPIFCCPILYFMIQLNYSAGQFFIFLLTYILLHISGSSVGILIGSAILDAKSVASVVPIVILPLMLFSGFFANNSTLPGWIGWIQYISPIKYGFIAFTQNQVSGRQSNVEDLNFDVGKWASIFILIGLGAGYRIISIFFLWALRSKSQ